MLRIRSLIRPLSGQKLNRWFSEYSTQSLAKVLREERVKVNNWNINYLKVGQGSHSVLCLPGALGTIWTDFKPQVEGFDCDKFTLIAWDPPGYGKSRPPEKEFTANFYENDADVAYEFMKVLNIPRYSVLGWSDGGIVAMILAAKHSEVVNKLVIWGSNSFILPKELDRYKQTRDIKTWSEKMKKPMIEVYGEDYFAKLWAKWCDGMETVFSANKGNICSHLLKDIKNPTLILHGEKDPLVDNVHVSHLHTHIDKSRIHLYPDGKHNIHLRYAEDFNRRVMDFLLLPEKS